MIGRRNAYKHDTEQYSNVLLFFYAKNVFCIMEQFLLQYNFRIDLCFRSALCS